MDYAKSCITTYLAIVILTSKLPNLCMTVPLLRIRMFDMWMMTWCLTAPKVFSHFIFFHWDGLNESSGQQRVQLIRAALCVAHRCTHPVLSCHSTSLNWDQQFTIRDRISCTFMSFLWSGCECNTLISNARSRCKEVKRFSHPLWKQNQSRCHSYGPGVKEFNLHAFTSAKLGKKYTPQSFYFTMMACNPLVLLHWWFLF